MRLHRVNRCVGTAWLLTAYLMTGGLSTARAQTATAEKSSVEIYAAAMLDMKYNISCKPGGW